MSEQHSAQLAAIIGTRPEAIKMAPVLRALAARGLECALVCTGQHRDLDLHGAGLRQPPSAWLPLDPRNLDADAMCDRIEGMASAWLERTRPRLVFVQGDTNSALGAARAAKRLGIAIGHVEAGLRTFDLFDPWPEERNRIEIDAIADLLFAPNETACGNLEAEGVAGRTYNSGNSGIDAVLEAAIEARYSTRSSARPMILVTVHRRENRGRGVEAVGEALRRIVAAHAVEIVIPLHPNAAARGEMIVATAGIAEVRLLESQSFTAMVGLMLRSHLILTDSGGLQEEGSALGRPVLILRASTERPEVIDSGNAILVGTDPGRIAGETLRLLRDASAHARMGIPAFPFGKGGAAGMIAAAVADYLRAPPVPHAPPVTVFSSRTPA